MGSNGSKEDEEEDGLPVKYARGCTSSEFSQKWRNDPKYKVMQERLRCGELDNYTKSCITIYGDRNHDDSETSVMLLDKAKIYNAPPRLQGIGSKQKSYINQLIELRTKQGTEDDVKGARKSDDKTKDGVYSRDMKGCGEPLLIKNCDQRFVQSRKSCNNVKNMSDDFLGLKCNNMIKSGDYLNKTDDSGSQSDPMPSRPSSPGWTASHIEESSLEGNISVVEGLEHIRSDMTVVPYDQAKARFESGTHKKRLKRNEAYLQLEQLGLGFWNNDQWVPTKVVTLAISDQLSCAGGDWPTNYRYRSNYNCQSYRSFTEVPY